MEVLDRPAVTVSAPVSAAPISDHLARRVHREFTSRWDTLWQGRSLLHGRTPGSDAVRLDGNDYLNLTGHPDIVRAQTDALRCDGEFVIQSSVFLLDSHPARSLEKSLARWIGKEDGLICQSGYSANLGLLQAIADPQTPVYLDTLAHTSLWEGARRAGAASHPFRHNDPQHLERLVARHGPGVVVVDSVYSTTGAVCPLESMVEVAERAGCAEHQLPQHVQFVPAAARNRRTGRNAHRDSTQRCGPRKLASQHRAPKDCTVQPGLSDPSGFRADHRSRSGYGAGHHGPA